MKRSLAFIAAAFSVQAVVFGGYPVMAEEPSMEIIAGQNANEASDSEASKETDSTVDAKDSENSEAMKGSENASVLEDGVYSAKFDTDSSMFHVNEANEGRGVLTVKDGKMTIHVSLASKGIINLFAGLAEDAKKEDAQLLEPTLDIVTYSDGMTEEVNGFDIPVPALNEEFDVALIGKKGKWYDHKVSVSDPVKEEAQGKTAADLGLEDGIYTADVTLAGGTGKATVESPAEVVIQGDTATATIIWSSPNYDYMMVDGEKYEMTDTEGNSTFAIPVTFFDAEMKVIADTVAMSTPHEIEYILKFDSASMKKAE